MNLTGYNKKEKLLQKFARIGLSAKGLVYCLLGILALTIALGYSNRKGNKEETFKIINEQPFGKVVLIIVAVSLLGFVMLRFFQAFGDINDKGKSMKAIFKRIGYAISGLIYLSISFFAFKVAFANSSGGDSKQLFIGKVMEYPGGRLIIAIVGGIVIGQGIYQIYRGISKRFMKKVSLYSSDFKGTFEKIGVVGNVARGAVLAIIGYFILHSAWNANPKEAEGTEGALSFLQESGGNWLLGIVALGLIAYGVFMFVRAKHERMAFDV